MAEDAIIGDVPDNLDLDNLDDMDLEELMNQPGMAEAAKRFMEMLESGNLTDDTRKNLMALMGGNEVPFGGYSGTSAVFLGLGFAAIIFFIILFFGYKLYKSIRDKEKKKEDKKKAKQQKKKK